MFLRSATMEDATRLFDWRNDPATRSASHATQALVMSDHLQWLERTLRSPDRRLLIAELDGVPVGTVRLDESGDSTELSWTVAPAVRERGIGKRMVQLAVASYPGPFRAEIKVGNIPSIRIAEYAGLKLLRNTNDILHYGTHMK